MIRTTLILAGFGLLVVGCVESGGPDTGSTQSAVGEPAPVVQDGFRESHPRGGPQVLHRVRSGNCVVVVLDPPSWAYRPDGTLMHPSEIHRPKDGNEQILFLNFEGPTITTGTDDPENNVSFIPNATVDFPVFDDTPFRGGTIDTREEVLYAIRQWVMYYYAHTDLIAVTERPPSGTAYTMMVIGGSPGLLNMPNGVLGVAPFDCYQDARNVAFVFSEDHSSNLPMLVQTIVHEAGHTFGLAHINDSQAIMNATASGGGDIHWGAASTTDSQACDGSMFQDSLAVLQDMLGTRTDNIPPWVEIYTPGRGAIVPSAFQALVHGTDNVALYAVEFFVDGASIRKETLPEFAFQLSNLLDGPHQLWAIGEDAHGNTFTSEPIDITVQSDCNTLGECTPGLNAVGDPCIDGSDCMTGICAASIVGPEGCGESCDVADGCAAGTLCLPVDPADPQSARACCSIPMVEESVCARACDADNPCPAGTRCLLLDPDNPEGEAYCAAGDSLSEIIEATSGFALSGCATAGRSVPAGVPGVLLLLLLLAIRRRR